MGCLYSVFNVKKQGKTVWVVRARNWKLRGGENRLSGFLGGVSVSGNVFTWLSSGLMMFGGLDWACVNKQWGGPNFCWSGAEYRYPNRVSVPKFDTGIWVSVPAREGIGTPGIDTCPQGIDTPLTLH
ncbi:hypothetical protein GQ457_17G014510 [Hibiscus cannabinus]